MTQDLNLSTNSPQKSLVDLIEAYRDPVLSENLQGMYLLIKIAKKDLENNGSLPIGALQANNYWPSNIRNSNTSTRST
jgi:hypothetical protein